MEAGSRTIEEVFNKGRYLKIPFFQRSYVWKEDNWRRFIDDMADVSESKKEYFMGSLILKYQHRSSDEKIGDLRLVIDGQQRLTTIILFFKVLCLNKNDDSLFETFYNREKDIILQHNYNDREIFEAIVNNNLNEQLKKQYKNNNVLSCYNFFLEKRSEFNDINPDILLNKLYFVGIDLGEGEDEQQIFDTMNSRGVSLTAAELLKNELFSTDDIELYESTWKEKFEGESKDFWDEKVSGSRTNIDLLLYAYLLDVSKSKDGERYVPKIESLFHNYKKLLAKDCYREDNNNRITFINNLMQLSDVYRDNIKQNLINESFDKDSPIERLNVVIFGLGHIAPIIPYILYLAKYLGDKKKKKKMFGLLESFLVRRTICRWDTAGYNKSFIYIRDKKIDEHYDEIKRQIPKDVDLKVAFEENKAPTNSQSKAILYMIETSLRSNKYSTQLLSLTNYTLEHIMPKKWRNNWPLIGNVSEDKRDKKVVNFGNLTIITQRLNSFLNDESWEIKKSGKGKMKGLDEYSKGIKIFDRPEFLESAIWDEKTIEQRSQFLYNKAKDIWKC